MGIAFGIWEIVDSSKELKNGSPLAKRFREEVKNLECISKDLFDFDEEMHIIGEQGFLAPLYHNYAR